LGWLIGSRNAQSPLANTLSERFGFKFHVLADPTSTPGVSAEGSSPLASTPLAWAPLGLLLEQSSQRVDSVDFLHPRRQHPKPDRRKLYIGLGVGAVVLLLAGIWFAIQSRVWQLEKQIASLKSENDAAQLLLDKNAPLRETAASIDDWAQRDIDWLEQFRTIEQAKGGADKLYLTSFDANVAGRNALAVIVATGRAKLPNEVDDFEDQLHNLGYRVTPKEISEDTTDPQYPVKIDLNLEIVPKAEGAAEPKGGPGIVRPGPKPAASSGAPSAPASAAPSSTPSAASTPATTSAATAVPGSAASEKSAAAPSGQASAEAPTVQPANQPAAAQPTASPMPAPNGEAATQSPMPAESGTQPMPQPSAPGKN
jgi:hypothetical protein